MIKLSVVLAVYNEEENLEACLTSIKDIAFEIVIVDGGSVDKTLEVAKKFNCRIISTSNPAIFHINKQKALEAATGEWILQLDADERVSKKLSGEIVKIINLKDTEVDDYQKKIPQRKLFLRHLELLEKRDGEIGTKSGKYSAFFVPRLNYFLGRYLRYGGTYPDGVIRLVRAGSSHFPCKSVHEQIKVNGRVGWLQNDLIHMADPTLRRYIKRNNRYINLLVSELVKDGVSKNFFQAINYFLLKPIYWFLLTQIRYKGVLDGIAGVVFSFFSALRFPRAYYRYLGKGK